VLVAQRPGFIQPVVLARMAATLDHLTGGGRIAIHFITGGDEADQRREGDFVPHDTRYRRTREMMSIVRRLWSEDTPFDFEGEFYRYENAFSSVKPVTPGASRSTSRERRRPPSRSARPRLTSTRSGVNRESKWPARMNDHQ
jgi:alkanesulfonate monooxygenase SsuD/methylene tetrahydromethanopterin reductase-like flavin-dependent oxidoreductase (luciferase family)